MQRFFSSKASDRNSFIPQPAPIYNANNLFINNYNPSQFDVEFPEKPRSISPANDLRKDFIQTPISINDHKMRRKKPTFMERLRNHRRLIIGLAIIFLLLMVGAIVAIVRYTQSAAGATPSFEQNNKTLSTSTKSFAATSTRPSTARATNSVPLPSSAARQPIGTNLRTMRGHTEGIIQIIAVPGTPPKLYTGSFDQSVREWDANSGFNTQTYLDPNNTWVIGLAYYPATQQTPARLYTGSTEPFIHEWDISNSKLLRNFAGHVSYIQFIGVLDANPPKLVSSSANGSFIQWDLVTGTPALVFNISQGLAFSNGFVMLPGTFPRLYSADSDTFVREWDLSTGKLVRTYTGHTAAVLRMALLPGAQPRLFSCSDDQRVIEWDITTGRVVRIYAGHTASVYSVQVIPGNPPRLFSASVDKSVIEWDMNTGNILNRFLGHTDGVTTLAYLPGNPPRLFSGSSDKTRAI